MKFNSIKNSSFSGLAKSVTRAHDDVFKAARDTAVDNTKIANEAIKGRSMERRAAMRAEANVAEAGFLASKKVSMTKKKIELEEDIRDIKRPAKRMAGIVGGLGAITQGYVNKVEAARTKAEKDAFRAEQEAVWAKQDAVYEKLHQQNQALIDQMTANLDNGDGNKGTNTDTDTDTEPEPASPSLDIPDSLPDTDTDDTVVRSVSPGSGSLGSGKDGFQKMYDLAQQQGAKYPQLVAAQWALESGWGSTPSGRNNPFGIKAGPNEGGTSKGTWEVINGKEVNTSARFKDFDSLDSAVGDLVGKWHLDYKGYKGVNNASDAYAAAGMLNTEGYATDPNYSKKLIRIMKDMGY